MFLNGEFSAFVWIVKLIPFQADKVIVSYLYYLFQVFNKTKINVVQLFFSL